MRLRLAAAYVFSAGAICVLKAVARALPPLLLVFSRVRLLFKAAIVGAILQAEAAFSPHSYLFKFRFKHIFKRVLFEFRSFKLRLKRNRKDAKLRDFKLYLCCLSALNSRNARPHLYLKLF